MAYQIWASPGTIPMTSSGTSSWTNTGGNLTLSTASSGTLALTSAGALNLTGAAGSLWDTVGSLGIGTTSQTALTLGRSGQTIAINSSTHVAASTGTSSWTNTSGNLTLSTATSGTLALSSVGALNFTAGANSTWAVTGTLTQTSTGTSSWVNTSGNLTINCATSGNLTLQCAPSGTVTMSGNGSSGGSISCSTQTTGLAAGNAFMSGGLYTGAFPGGSVQLTGGGSTGAAGGDVILAPGNGTSSGVIKFTQSLGTVVWTFDAANKTLGTSGANLWTNTSGNLTISTATSGTMIVDSVAALQLGNTNATSIALGKTSQTNTIDGNWTLTSSGTGAGSGLTITGFASGAGWGLAMTPTTTTDMHYVRFNKNAAGAQIATIASNGSQTGLRIDAGANLGLGTADATSVTIGRSGQTATVSSASLTLTTASLLFSTDTRIYRNATKSIVIDDGAGGPMTTNITGSCVHTVSSAINVNGVTFTGYQSGGAWGATWIPANSTDTQHMRFLSSASATIGSIATTSSQTATLFNTTSDRRLKENIVTAPTTLSLINGIQVRGFNFKSAPTLLQYGFIADELEDAGFSSMVTGTRNAVDADGHIQPQQVDYSKLVPYLVKAVQELSSRERVCQLFGNATQTFAADTFTEANLRNVKFNYGLNKLGTALYTTATNGITVQQDGVYLVIAQSPFFAAGINLPAASIGKLALRILKGSTVVKDLPNQIPNVGLSVLSLDSLAITTSVVTEAVAGDKFTMQFMQALGGNKTSTNSSAEQNPTLTVIKL